MAVSGPSYSQEKVDKIFNKVVDILKQEKILNYDCFGPLKKAHEENRKERYLKLYLAIQGLVEIDSWESF